MSVININADQNQAIVVTINDATAATGENILVQFFADDINVFNKAVSTLGGKQNELTINNGVSYVFTLSAADALRLNGANSNTYKMFKLSNSVDTAPVLKNNGDITVEPLEGSEPIVEKTFSQKRKYRHVLAHLDQLLPDDEVIVIHPPDGHSGPFVFALLDPALHPGKEIMVLNAIDLGEITVTLSNSATQLAAGEAALLFDDGNEWIRFF
ncbi:MAG: hypothetical protein IPM56_16250 [Ignavibacteriales bacterium]|nr:MAG: hypothetical protein IPM56_16250 [Ignavibacteriales bacterium]